MQRRSSRYARDITALALIASAACAAVGEAQERGASGITRPQQRVSDPAALAIEAGGGLAGMTVGAAMGLGLLLICMETDPDARLIEDPPGCAAPTMLVGAAVTLVGGVIGVKLAARSTGAPRSTGGAIVGLLAGALAGGLLVNAIGNTFEEPPDAVAVSAYAILQGAGLALGSRIGGR